MFARMSYAWCVHTQHPRKLEEGVFVVRAPQLLKARCIAGHAAAHRQRLTSHLHTLAEPKVGQLDLKTAAAALACNA
jgi:hypothetical protein